MAKSHSPQTFVPNPLVRFRYKNGLVYQNPQTTHEYPADSWVLRVLLYLHKPATKAQLLRVITQELTSGQAQEAFDHLIRTGVLQVASNMQPYSLWLERSWRNALYYHLLTSVPASHSHRHSGPVQQLLSRAVDPLTIVKLPGPTTNHASLGQILLGRRTTRHFDKEPVSLEQLATILSQASQPDTPYELYFSAQNITGLSQGLYHYDHDAHALGLIRPGDCTADIRRAAVGQNVDQCAAVLMISARLEEYMQNRPGSRAYRQLLIDTAALGHRIILSAEALGLRTFVTAALNDSLANELFGLDGLRESVMYLVGIGVARQVRVSLRE
jgi:SagB-type dehydrogenase family enzyme